MRRAQRVARQEARRMPITTIKWTRTLVATASVLVACAQGGGGEELYPLASGELEPAPEGGSLDAFQGEMAGLLENGATGRVDYPSCTELAAIDTDAGLRSAERPVG